MLAATKPLAGQLAVLIEDDPFLANYVGEAVVSAGAQIIGPARNPGEGALLIQRLRVKPNAVLVSATVLGMEETGLAEALVRLDAPVLLMKKDHRGRDPSFPCAAVLTLPFAAHQVVDRMPKVGNLTPRQILAER
jgi:hypothetical protein